jgi:hypothetical protein
MSFLSTPGLRTARKAAIPALLLSLALGGLGLAPAAHAASGSSCASLPAATCPAPRHVTITGDHNHVHAVPHDVQNAVDAFDVILDWPTAPRMTSWEYNWVYTPAGHLQRTYVATGGRYWDNGADLTNWLHRGGAGAHYTHWQGGFQEYYGHVYNFNPGRNPSNHRLGTLRIVRAVGRGQQPTWVTTDHYRTFQYIGLR